LLLRCGAEDAGLRKLGVDIKSGLIEVELLFDDGFLELVEESENFESLMLSLDFDFGLKNDPLSDESSKLPLSFLSFVMMSRCTASVNVLRKKNFNVCKMDKIIPPK